MIAVILAAGRGTRLRPLTDAIPKALVPFRGKPILAHAVEALRRGGVTDVAVVTGYRADRIAALAPELGVVMRHNSRFASTNMVASLFCAEDLMQDDDLLVVYGDIVFRPAIVASLREDDAPFAVAVNVRWRELWALRMRDPLVDAETLKLDAAGHIVEIGKTPRSYDEVQGQYMGLIRIGRDALPAVRAFYHSLDRGGTFDELCVEDTISNRNWLNFVPYPSTLRGGKGEHQVFTS
jgi:choline kinase